MKTSAIFVAVCIGFTCASMRFPTNLDFLGNGLRNAIGIDISDFNGVRNLFNQAGSGAARESILTAAATAFAARFRNGPFLQGKSVRDIMTSYKDNIRSILSGPIDPSWRPGIDNEVLGLNQKEYDGLLGTRPESRPSSSNVTSSRRKRQATSLPKSVDWRDRGAVTPVKNQEKCGSCWAFAAVGALEGRIGVKTGKAPVLSEQNLVDCAKNVNGSTCCSGCDGGWMTDGYSYVQLNNGIASNDSYPYEAANKECRAKDAKMAGQNVGFEYTAQDDEEDLKRAVAEGPVAVAVDANNFKYYKNGIFRCQMPIIGSLQKLKINHGVVVVGYGTSTSLFDGYQDYWIVKNSWGKTWGEDGYIRIARNAKNQCGIAGQANYPLV